MMDQVQELEKQKGKAVFEMDEAVMDAVAEDRVSKQTRDNKIRPMLGEKECLIQNCAIKVNLEKSLGELKDSKSKYKALVVDNERLRKALESGASPEEMQDCRVKAMRDGMVQVLRSEADSVRQIGLSKDSEIARLRRQVSDSLHEKDEYVRLLQTDEALYERYKQNKLLDERAAKMQAWLKDAQGRYRSIEARVSEQELKLLKVKEHISEAVQDFEHKKRLVAQAETILNDGFRVEPVPGDPGGVGLDVPPQPPLPPQKRSWFRRNN
jgi:hypothetical protein